MTTCFPFLRASATSSFLKFLIWSSLVSSCSDLKPEHPLTSRTFSLFSPVTTTEVTSLILRCPTKSSSLDPIPTYHLKNLVDVLVAPITKIVNLSLSSGVYHNILILVALLSVSVFVVTVLHGSSPTCLVAVNQLVCLVIRPLLFISFLVFPKALFLDLFSTIWTPVQFMTYLPGTVLMIISMLTMIRNILDSG
jgi:hypothetical protein